MAIFKKLHKRSDVEFYYVRYELADGRRRAEKAGTTLDQARRLLKKRLGEVTSGTFVDPKALASDTLSKVLDQFEANYRSRGGTDFHKRMLKPVRAFLGAQLINTIDAAAIDRYLAHRRLLIRADKGRKVSESSLRKECVVLGTALRWSRARGLVAANIMSDYTKPKAPSERNITVLSSEQETALAAKCSRDLWDVVEWALYSGMRFGEACSMSWRDIDRGAGIVQIVGTKTGRARTVPLDVSARLGAILDRHPQRTDTNFLFHEPDGGLIDKDGLNRRLKAAMKAAKIQRERGTRWNIFRHSFITRMAATGRFSTFEIADMTGTSPQMIEKHYRAYFPVSREKVTGALDGPPREANQPDTQDRKTA